MLKLLKLTHSLSYILLLLSCILFSYLLIPAWFSFPYLGLALIFLCLCSGVYVLQSKKTLFCKFLYATCAVLSIFLVLRANLFLTFLNILGIIYALSLLTRFGKMRYSIIQILFSPFLLLLGIFRAKSLFAMPKRFSLPEKYRKIDEHIPAIALTIILLIIIIPLLSYANPFFNELITNIINTTQRLLSLEWLFKQNLLPYILRLITFFLLVFFIPRIFQIALMSHQEFDEEMGKSHMSYIIPKVAVSVVLIIFFITQMQLYIATNTELLKIGYTNSEQTSEIFAQLCIVTGIIFGLLYADNNQSAHAKLLTNILLIEAFFLNLIALKSDYDYSHTFGFTEKRLYGFSGIIWLFAICSLYARYYMKQYTSSWLLKSIISISLIVLSCINLTNFDYLIYHYGKSTTQSGIDYFYLSHLSPDALSYQTLLDQMVYKMETTKESADLQKYLLPAYHTLYAIDYLKAKYSTHFHLGSFNLSEYVMYLQIKDLPENHYRSQLNHFQQIYFHQLAPHAIPYNAPLPVGT